LIGRRPEWLSFHIFYGSNPLGLLTRCVRPLVHQLKTEGKLERWFYINYWLEGNHIRLRLGVPDKATATEVEMRVTVAVEEYLALNPSFHPAAELESTDYYAELFEAEFSAEERGQYFNADGTPILQPDNSVRIRRYEPEWDRYGGAKGVEIAEEHFELSAEIASKLIAKGNMSVRSFQLGVGAELMAVLVGVLFPNPATGRAFLENYHARWSGMFGTTKNYVERHNQGRFTDNRRVMMNHVVPVCQAARAGGHGLTGVLKEWHDAVTHTRNRLEDVGRNEELRFAWEGGEETTSDIDRLCWREGFSLQHMMDNRLLLSVSDEAYLSFELLKALETADVDEVAV
jgi:hypothetical protein